MAAPVEARVDDAARLPRRALAAGGLLLLAGLGLVGIGPSDAGMAVALAGFVAMIYGVHTFGRLGPDDGPSSPEPR